MGEKTSSLDDKLEGSRVGMLVPPDKVWIGHVETWHALPGNGGFGFLRANDLYAKLGCDVHVLFQDIKTALQIYWQRIVSKPADVSKPALHKDAQMLLAQSSFGAGDFLRAGEFLAHWKPKCTFRVVQGGDSYKPSGCDVVFLGI